MREYEIYLPMQYGDGRKVPEALLEEVKKQLSEAFGGYTHLRHRTEGEWRMGGVTLRDEITVLRVLEGERTDFDMVAFRKKLEHQLQQESVLVVVRDVATV